jgi:hypothetical protein
MMKNTLLLFLTTCFASLLLSQKKQIFIDDNLKIISKADFNKKVENIRFQSIETDSVIYNIRVEHKASGKLSDENFSLLKKKLNTTDDKTIVIYYYHGLDNCNQNSDTNILVLEDFSIYPKKFKRNNAKLYYLYQELDGLKNRLKKANWIDDTSGEIENMFFKIKYPCGSAIIVFKNGEYTVFRGEFRWQDVLDEAKKGKAK